VQNDEQKHLCDLSRKQKGQELENLAQLKSCFARLRRQGSGEMA
jgi:hypothetical protein